MSDLRIEPAVFVGGRWVPANGQVCEVESPITELGVGLVTEADSDNVDEAVDAAGRALGQWSGLSPKDRAGALRRLSAVLHDRADLLAEIVHLEQGSPIRVARSLHVDVPLRVIDATIDALETFQFEELIGNSLIVKEAVGVVAAITPWNLPLHQVVIKVLPALAAGATVVLKPAALTPLSALELARAFESADLPPGIFNVVTGSGSVVGAALVDHPGVDAVSFTGSTSVGSQVAQQAMRSLKRVTLELGGKSASVVLGDVDDGLLAKAVKVTVANCFLNGGQTCTALSRLIVPESRLDDVEDLARAAAEKYTLGERLGPLISSSQKQTVTHFLDRAVGGSETVTVLGGSEGVGDMELPAVGYFTLPTVFSRVDPHSEMATEEIFGPVLSIIAASTDDEALKFANDTVYGLGGAVWSNDDERALEAARKIRTGQIDINGAAFNPSAPFGGFKQSGIGREAGTYGIADALEIKSIQR